MYLQLRWGHVTAAKEITTPQLSPNRTYGAGRPHISHISSYFLTRDLRGPWADLREILPHVQKHVQFINAGPKIWGSVPKKIFLGGETR